MSDVDSREEPSTEPEEAEVQDDAGSPGPQEPPRRGALRTLAVVGGCAYAGALTLPALGMLKAPEGSASSSEETTWYRVAKLESLKEGTPTRAKITGDDRDAFTVSKNQTIGSVWLIKEGEALRAMSAECPHLGCAIDASADGKGFTCPCHTSSFALDGTPQHGPSPRPMDELATRVTDEGWVEVDFRRYRQGIADKVEA